MKHLLEDGHLWEDNSLSKRMAHIRGQCIPSTPGNNKPTDITLASFVQILSHPALLQLRGNYIPLIHRQKMLNLIICIALMLHLNIHIIAIYSTDDILDHCYNYLYNWCYTWTLLKLSKVLLLYLTHLLWCIFV